MTEKMQQFTDLMTTYQKFQNVTPEGREYARAMFDLIAPGVLLETLDTEYPLPSITDSEDAMVENLTNLVKRTAAAGLLAESADPTVKMRAVIIALGLLQHYVAFAQAVDQATKG